MFLDKEMGRNEEQRERIEGYLIKYKGELDETHTTLNMSVLAYDK